MKKTIVTYMTGLLLMTPTTLLADESGGGPFVQGDQPLQFSFSMRPTDFPTLATDTSKSTQLQARLIGEPGVTLDTKLTSGAARGGLSFFHGPTGAGLTPEAYAAFYSKGLQLPDTLLFLPDQVYGPNEKLFGADDFGSTQALSLYGGYELTPSLKIKGAFLISKTKKETEPIDSGTKLSSTSYGWWVDLGGDYKLNDSMTYSINFGYADSDQSTNEVNSQEAVQGSVYLFNNQLNMSF